MVFAYFFLFWILNNDLLSSLLKVHPFVALPRFHRCQLPPEIEKINNEILNTGHFNRFYHKNSIKNLENHKISIKADEV